MSIFFFFYSFLKKQDADLDVEKVSWQVLHWEHMPCELETVSHWDPGLGPLWTWDRDWSLYISKREFELEMEFVHE